MVFLVSGAFKVCQYLPDATQVMTVTYLSIGLYSNESIRDAIQQG